MLLVLSTNLTLLREYTGNSVYSLIFYSVTADTVSIQPLTVASC